MKIERFILKTTVRIVTCIVLTIIYFALINSPILTNELALTQMQNSNELYLITEIYNKAKPILTVIYSGIVILIGCNTIYDTYNFINTKNKGEN